MVRVSKHPNLWLHGLFRATHSHNPVSIRILVALSPHFILIEKRFDTVTKYITFDKPIQFKYTVCAVSTGLRFTSFASVCVKTEKQKTYG